MGRYGNSASMPIYMRFPITIRSGLGVFEWIWRVCGCSLVLYHMLIVRCICNVRFAFRIHVSFNRASKPRISKLLVIRLAFPLQNRPSDNIPPPPNAPSLLQLHDPPQTFLRLLHLPALLVRPGERKPRLAVIPSRSTLGQCG